MLSEQDLSPPTDRLLEFSRPSRSGEKDKERETEKERERFAPRKRGLLATQEGDTAFCFFLIVFFSSLFILCPEESDKKDDASAKFDTLDVAALHLLCAVVRSRAITAQSAR